MSAHSKSGDLIVLQGFWQLGRETILNIPSFKKALTARLGLSPFTSVPQ